MGIGGSSGRDMKGIGEGFGGEATEKGLLVVLRAAPAYRRYWKVELNEDGRPTDPEALRRVAGDDVLVRLRGLSEAGRA